MMKWLFKYWDKYRQRIDEDTLWPICKEYAVNMTQAREAFADHALNDVAWTRQMSREEIIVHINNLT